MSRYPKKNRKRSKHSRFHTNPVQQQARELRQAMNNTEDNEDNDAPTDGNNFITTYSSFVAFNSMSNEAINKLKSDIEKLRSHLAAAHAELEDLNVETVSFKKNMSKYQKKVEFIDKIALGSGSGSSIPTKEPEPEPSTSKRRLDEYASHSYDQRPSTSGVKPRLKATCTITVPDDDDDDDDEEIT